MMTSNRNNRRRRLGGGGEEEADEGNDYREGDASGPNEEEFSTGLGRGGVVVTGG